MQAENPILYGQDQNEERERREAQQGYTGAFLEIVASRLPIPNDLPALKGYEQTGFQTTLRVEIYEGDDPIELPKSLQAVVAGSFKGFPIDEKTGQPALRVKGILFLHNRVAIDVEPTIETPKREGKEKQFITYPDYSRAVHNRIGIFIDKGDYIVGLGNPTGRSEWMTRGDTIIPFAGERGQITTEAINELTTLVSEMSARPHSDLILHNTRPHSDLILHKTH